MINKDSFIESIHSIMAYNEELDKIEKIIGGNIFESNICQAVWKIADNLINVLAEENMDLVDLICWWLYEDVDKILYIGNNELDVSDIGQLYDYIKENYYDNKRN